MSEDTIKELKIDLGCGKHKAKDYFGVDIRELPETDLVYDLRTTPWPWEDSSVDALESNFLLPYLTPESRIDFFNESWRILKPNGKLVIRVPHWSNMRAIQDPFAKWPPICETTFLAYDKQWRDLNDCFYYDYPITADFSFGYGHAIDGETAARNDDYKRDAVRLFNNVVIDIMVTMTARK
jgi:SAM-dependent methyltransferase